MATLESFEQLEVWQTARELSNQIYAITKRESFAKDFPLRDQIRRAGVSVMSNIAEGFGRGSSREFKYFLSVASGSASEVCSQLYMARDQGYIDELVFAELRALTWRISQMIARLSQYLARHQSERSPVKGGRRSLL